MDIKIDCRRCGEAIDVPITKEQFAAWQAGEYIQRAAPNLTPGQREMLISRTCDECFDELFGEDE
jgi:hypothetical protein